jgi:predicted Zn-dependent protease
MRGNTSAQLSEQDPRDQELQLLRQLQEKDEQLQEKDEQLQEKDEQLQEKDEQLDAAGGFCNVRVEQRAFASVRYAL